MCCYAMAKSFRLFAEEQNRYCFWVPDNSGFGGGQRFAACWPVQGLSARCLVVSLVKPGSAHFQQVVCYGIWARCIPVPNVDGCK